MYISEVIQSKAVTLSFEVFPPKTQQAYDSVSQAVSALSLLAPDYMSVTYGAGGGTSKNTARIAGEIQNQLNTIALAHLSCVSSTKEGILSILQDLKSQGISNILALGGDQPDDDSHKPLPDDYRYASELVSDIKAFGGFCIGAACYPEGHVRSKNIEEDLHYLKNKIDKGVDFLITQMFFDNSVMYSFLSRALKKNIDVPVMAGVMPVTSAKTIKRMQELSGARLTPRLWSLIDRWGDNPESMQQAGIIHASEQILDLIANGVQGVHIYTMNKPEIAAEIQKNIGFALNVKVDS